MNINNAAKILACSVILSAFQISEAMKPEEKRGAVDALNFAQIIADMAKAIEEQEADKKPFDDSHAEIFAVVSKAIANPEALNEERLVQIIDDRAPFLIGRLLKQQQQFPEIKIPEEISTLSPIEQSMIKDYYTIDQLKIKLLTEMYVAQISENSLKSLQVVAKARDEQKPLTGDVKNHFEKLQTTVVAFKDSIEKINPQSKLMNNASMSVRAMTWAEKYLKINQWDKKRCLMFLMYESFMIENQDLSKITPDTLSEFDRINEFLTPQDDFVDSQSEKALAALGIKH